MTSEPTSRPDPTRPPPGYDRQPYGPPPGQYPQQPLPQYGQPQYGQPQYGQPQYGQPQYGQPQYGQPPYPRQPHPPGYPPPGHGQPGGYPPSGYGAPPGQGPGQGLQRPGAVPQEWLAGWPTRVKSFAIDVIGPTIAFYVLVLLGGVSGSDTLFFLAGVVGWLGLIGFIVWNSGYRQGTTGQSIGKKVAGTRLVSIRTGLPIGFGMAFVRHLAHIVDGLPLWIGYLWPLWDDQRQTFADKICSTVVVKTT